MPGQPDSATPEPGSRLPGLASKLLVPAAMLAGSVLWGMNGLYTGSISVLVAVLVGGGIVQAFQISLRGRDEPRSAILLSQIAGATLISAAMGDIFGNALGLSQQGNMSFVEALVVVASNLSVLYDSPASFAGFGFALIGAILAFISRGRK